MGDGWQEQPVASVNVGSRIRVRTGSRVPLDARVESGRAALNQAPITGESLPVDKQIGDSLYAGSIVTDGVVEAVVTAAAGESTLADRGRHSGRPITTCSPHNALSINLPIITPAVIVVAIARWRCSVVNHRRCLERVALSVLGTAGDCLSLRPRDFHTCHGSEWFGGCGQARHPD